MYLLLALSCLHVVLTNGYKKQGAHSETKSNDFQYFGRDGPITIATDVDARPC